VELLTGALFAVVALAFADSLFPQGVVLLLYVGLLIAIFFIDFEHQLVLDKVIFPALPIVLLLAPWGPPGTGAEGWSAYLSALAGGGAALALFLAIFWVARSRDGMGAGDVKLSLLVGLMLGAPLVVVAVLLAFVTGGIVAVLLLAFRRKGLKSPIPSATFLTGGAIVAIVWGNALWEWYLGLFR
jgi:leader peptidase (prepilin peptidase)/N-methyltransferase